MVENVRATLEEVIAKNEVRRKVGWTKCLVVGSVEYSARIRSPIRSRRQTELVEAMDHIWDLQEPALPYGAEAVGKTRAKGL